MKMRRSGMIRFLAAAFGVTVAVGAVGAASPGALAPADLKGRWKMDEGSGTTLADASGNGNSGTLQNGVAWTAGRAGQGQALSFDGVDDYVVLGTNGLPAANAAQTVSFWMNVAAVPASVAMAVDLSGANSGVQAGFRNGRLTVWKWGGGVLVDTTAPVTNAWHHVAYVYDGTTHRLYVNGAQVSSSTASPNTAVPTTAVLGRWNGGAAEYFAGKLDEVRVYARALSLGEIQGLAHGGGLEAHYKLDESSGTTAQDSSGSDYAGTLTNGAVFTTDSGRTAVSLDGADDYVSLGTGLNALRKVPGATLAAWVKINALPASGASMELVSFSIGGASPTSLSRARIKLIGTGTGANLVGGGRSTDAEGLQDLQDSSTPLGAGTWYHVAGVIDFAGQVVKLYVNGSQVASGAKSFASSLTPDTPSASATLGSEDDGSAGYFNGLMDEVRVYSRALSAEEIAGLAGGSGTGLSAVYYDNMDWTGTFVTRTDAQINFNWGSGSPDASIGADTFSAVWTGQVQPQYSEVYTFYTLTDDGVRLWVNGRLVVDYPQDQSPTERSGSIALSGGTKYDLRMEYFENGGGARAELRWSSPSTPKALIPQSQLYPTDGTAPRILAATSNAADLTKVYVRFSEAMAKSTVEAAGNWTLSGGLTVVSASLSSDKRVATLAASGSVSVGTTQVTASSGILGITREGLASPWTHTIVEGNPQGIPGATAITLIMTTDGNHSAVMLNEPSSFGVPQGVGEMFRVEAPGTSPTMVTLRQAKKLGGKGQIWFGETGTDTSATVTTSGGTPNVAFAVCRHRTTSAFGGDIVVEAVVSDEVRATKDVTAVELGFSTKYAYLPDQVPFTTTAQVTPALQNLELVNRTYLMDFGKTNTTKETTLLKLPAWSPTNASGQATRTLAQIGVNRFSYDAIELKRPQIGLFNTVEGSKVCQKEKDPDPPYEYGYPDSLPGTSDYSSVCPNADSQDSGSSGQSSGVGGNASCCGRSVDLSDGEKKLAYRDLVIQGRGLDFEFRRTYRSNNTRRSAQGRGIPVVQDFGKGWTYSYADEYLVKDGAGAEDASNYINFRAGHSGTVFVNTGSGRWSPGQDHFVQLRRNPSTGDFEIREADGTVRGYHNFQTTATPNKNGRLKFLRDRNGNRLTFHYEQIDPDDAVSGDEKFILAYVVDTLGREIRYQYYAKTAQTVNGRPVTLATANSGALGRLARVKDFKGNMDFDGTQEPDFPGQVNNRTLVFDYDSEGNLVRVSGPAVAGTGRLTIRDRFCVRK